MSDLNFLLTETALKLLGNDFFDIYGNSFDNLKDLINFNTKHESISHETNLEECLELNMNDLMTKSETEMCKQPYLEHINSTKTSVDAMTILEDDHDDGIIQEEDISDNTTLDDRDIEALFDNDDDNDPDDGSLLTPMFKHKLNIDLEPEPATSSLPAVHLKQMVLNNKKKIRRKPRLPRKPSLRENLVKEYFKNSPLLAIQKNSKLSSEKADSEYFEFRIKVEREYNKMLNASNIARDKYMIKNLSKYPQPTLHKTFAQEEKLKLDKEKNHLTKMMKQIQRDPDNQPEITSLAKRIVIFREKYYNNLHD